MAEYLIQSETLDDIADAINAKTGGTSAMTPAEMVTEIESIQTGGGSVSDSVTVALASASTPSKIASTIAQYVGDAFVAICTTTAPESGYWIFWIAKLTVFVADGVEFTSPLMRRRTSSGNTENLTNHTGTMQIPAGTTFKAWKARVTYYD